MKIRKHPLRLKGDGWSLNMSVFCGERWYRPVSWRRYERFGRLTHSNGFHIGPILFWKEG